MITVQDAGALAGYSGEDHMIEAGKIKDIIGRDFPSVGAALKAADSRCKIRGRPHPYTWVEVRMADGTTRTHKSTGIK